MDIMPRAPSLDQLFERAMTAAGGEKPRPKMKKACPAERLIATDEGVECAQPGRPTKVKIGPFVARLNKRGVVKGPHRLAGMPAGSLPAIARDIKNNVAHTKECDDAARPVKYQTFESPKAALSGLFKANPKLSDAIYRIWPSKIDDAYTEWVARGMRGPRPTIESAYGSSNTQNLPVLDFLSGFIDRPGRKRKIYSITEALYATIPTSRRWDDWMPALEALQAEVNRHAREDDYIQAWHEIKVPGRAGAAITKSKDRRDYCKANEPKTPSRIIQEHRERLARRDPGSDDGDGDVPF